MLRQHPEASGASPWSPQEAPGVAKKFRQSHPERAQSDPKTCLERSWRPEGTLGGFRVVILKPAGKDFRRTGNDFGPATNRFCASPALDLEALGDSLLGMFRLSATRY